MVSAKRLISRSLAATVTPERNSARLAEIEKIPQPAKRAAALLLHTMALSKPKAAGRLVGLQYQNCDMEYIGSGYDCIVLRKNEDDVIKIHPRTLFMTPPKREEYLRTKNDQFAAMYRYMGGFMLEQRLSIEPHPVLANMPVVQTLQPYVDNAIDPRLTGQSLGTESICSSLYRLQRDHPTAASQLPEFIERSWDLYEKTQLLPDIEGSSNLVVEPAGHLLMLDGQPIGTNWPGVQQKIDRQLGELELRLLSQAA